MFAYYTGKVIAKLGRVLSPSELSKLAEFYNKGYSVIYAIEYFR